MTFSGSVKFKRQFLEIRKGFLKKIISKNVSQTELDVDDFDGKWAISEKN